MAQDSWPSPNHNSRNVTDSEYEKIAAHFSEDGIFPTTNPVVTAGSGLQVLVKANQEGSLRGHYWSAGTSDVALSIDANASGSTRTDAVVLQLDRSTWDVRAVVIDGTPGSGPPALTRDAGTVGEFEILLAYVTVANGASSVTVTDRPQFIGSRVRAENTANPNPILGEIGYRPSLGHWQGWNGSAWVPFLTDSGDLSLTVGFSTWEVTGPMIGRRIGGTVSVEVNLKRVGETFSENDSDGSHVATVPSAIRPARDVYGACQFTNGASGRLEARTNGEIWVTSLSGSVGVGRGLRFSMTWLKP